MIDNVNSPKHYTDGCIECIDAIEASMTKEQFVGYLKGNIQKYVWRMNLKHDNPSEDAYKAQWYLNKLIETIDA
jgi:beta-lactamase class D